MFHTKALGKHSSRGTLAPGAMFFFFLQMSDEIVLPIFIKPVRTVLLSPLVFVAVIVVKNILSRN